MDDNASFPGMTLFYIIYLTASSRLANFPFLI
jgi:hypothetical protein